MNGPDENDALPALVRLAVGLAARLVPEARREVWRRQWDADLRHLSASGRGLWATLRYASGSWAHAVYLRREEMTMGTMRGIFGDMRHSARALLRRPGFSGLTVLTLAVGIGMATAVYSLTEAILFRTLPLPDASELVELVSTNPERGLGRFNVSYPDFVDLTGRSDLFATASFYQAGEQDLAGDGSDVGQPVRIGVTQVHRGFFETLGSGVILGRALSDEDQAPSAAATVLLAEPLWRARYGADPDILGRTIRLDGVPYTVVGVVAEGEGMPFFAQAWVALRFGAAPPAWVDVRSNHSWNVVARLQQGVGIEEARAQVQAMARGIYAEPEDARDLGLEADVLPLRAATVNEAEVRLFGVMGVAVLLVLGIACMNASGLLMTYLSGRARELSLRAALGAGRTRLLAQLLSESFMLSLGGGVLGLAGAVVGVGQLARFGPPGMAEMLDVQVNAAVLVGALGICALATVLAGLLPALGASRATAAAGLREGGSQGGAGRRSRRFRNTLVVAELALSVMLLTGAGLTVRSFQRQLAADPGFSTEGLLAFTVRLPEARYPEAEQVREFFQTAVERLEATPGVRQASAASALPAGGPGMQLYRAFGVEGEPDPPEGVAHNARWIEVSPGFFESLGVSPIAGRTLTLDDVSGTAPVMTVNEAFARRLASEAGANAAGVEGVLGMRLRSVYDERVLREVVGIIPDLQLQGIAQEASPAVYVPASQAPRLAMAFLVRTPGDPGAVISGVRQAMRDLDPDLALSDLSPLEASRRAELGGIRFLMSIFGSFGVMALILAVSGVYGLVSYSVSQRTREIGIRMAVGATASGVQGRLFAEGARLTALGLAAGVGLALGFAKLLSFALFGLEWLDPGTFAGVLALLSVSALLASWIPARRATRVDPVKAIRAE